MADINGRYATDEFSMIVKKFKKIPNNLYNAVSELYKQYFYDNAIIMETARLNSDLDFFFQDRIDILYDKYPESFKGVLDKEKNAIDPAKLCAIFKSWIPNKKHNLDKFFIKIDPT